MTQAPPPSSPRLKLVPAQQGVRWVRLGLTAFVRKPLSFAALLSSFLFFALLCALLPLVGTVLLLMSLPLVTVGFMLAGQAATQDRFAMPGVFVLPLRQDRARTVAHIQLGVVYAVATVVIVLLSEWLDGGRLSVFQELMASGKAEPEAVSAALSDGRLQAGLIARFGLITLLSLPFWHAPALVHWCGQSAFKALFFSTVACWRNRGAFFLYGLAWLGLLMGVAVLSSLVLGLLGAAQAATLLAAPVTLLFASVFYASLYFTFADCFETGPLPVLPE